MTPAEKSDEIQVIREFRQTDKPTMRIDEKGTFLCLISSDVDPVRAERLKGRVYIVFVQEEADQFITALLSGKDLKVSFIKFMHGLQLWATLMSTNSKAAYA